MLSGPLKLILYRGGLNMQGTSVIIGTRYMWNFGKNRDRVCLERWFHWGPNMPGTLFDED